MPLLITKKKEKCMKLSSISITSFIIISIIFIFVNNSNSKEVHYHDVMFNDYVDVPVFENKIHKPVSKHTTLKEYLESLDKYFTVNYSKNKLTYFKLIKKGNLKNKFSYYNNTLEKITHYNPKGEEIKVDLIDRAWDVKYYKNISENKNHYIVFEDKISPSTPEYLQEKDYYFKVFTRNNIIHHYEYYKKNKCNGQYSFCLTNDNVKRIVKKAIIYNELGTITQIIYYNKKGAIKNIARYNSYNLVKDRIKIRNGKNKIIHSLDIDVNKLEE